MKQYFEKIKIVEQGSAQPRANLSLNKQAAGRVIKHALVRGRQTHVATGETNSQQAGNDKHDLERAEREAKEKLMAKRKLQAMNQKEDVGANPSSDASEDESEEDNGEVEQGMLRATNTTPDAPKSLADPSTHENKNGNKHHKHAKRMSKRAEKRERKRKRGQQDQGDQATKKKKAGKGKNKNKQDRKSTG